MKQLACPGGHHGSHRLSMCSYGHTDVWSFGILLQETFSQGPIPYAGTEPPTASPTADRAGGCHRLTWHLHSRPPRGGTPGASVCRGAAGKSSAQSFLGGGRGQCGVPGRGEARWAPASSPCSPSGRPATGTSSHEAFQRMESGYRMPCPPECPAAATHKLMLSCWYRDPKHRPCFQAIREKLSSVSTYENPL